jgi:hypothetical protein
MTKLKTNKTFIKDPRKKLEIKKIKCEIEIPKTKRINVYSEGEERGKK